MNIALALDNWYLWSQIAVVLCGLATLITGKMVNDRETEKNKRQAKQLIELETDLGKQREKTALAEKTLLEIQERFAPRTLTGERRDKFLKALEDVPRGKIEMTAVASDPEVFAFATQIRETLQTAGFDVGERIGSILLFGAPGMGLAVGIKDANTPPLHAGPIQKAFGSVGLPADGLILGDDLTVVYIRVGIKPTQ